MASRTKSNYFESIRDDRTVYARGERVEDVTSHPATRVSAEHAAGVWKLQEESPEQFTYESDDGEIYSAYFRLPRGTDDLLARRDLIEASTRRHMGVFNIVQAVGTDILQTWLTVLPNVDDTYGTDYMERALTFYEYCREENLAMACAMTDPKGDRIRAPHEQLDPDLFLRVVDRTTDGVVVRGAKMHTTLGPVSEELLVLPTIGMDEEDEDYAFAGAVPTDADGIEMICRPQGSADADPRDAPVSSRHDETESLTVFDDVFVPTNRVFLDGETAFTADLVQTFATFHRFTALGYKSPIAERFLGAASLAARYNGIQGAGHVREKLTDIVEYIQNIRAFGTAAAVNYTTRNSLAVPDPSFCDFGKYNFASRYHQMERHVQDIAGGVATTTPAAADLDNPETGDLVRKFFRAAGNGEERFALMNYVRDLVASDFSGWHEVTTLHGEGSMQAQRIAGFHGFDIAACEQLVAEDIDIEVDAERDG